MTGSSAWSYVWTAYGIVFGSMTLYTLSLLSRWKEAQREGHLGAAAAGAGGSAGISEDRA